MPLTKDPSVSASKFVARVVCALFVVSCQSRLPSVPDAGPVKLYGEECGEGKHCSSPSRCITVSATDELDCKLPDAGENHCIRVRTQKTGPEWSYCVLPCHRAQDCGIGAECIWDEGAAMNVCVSL